MCDIKINFCFYKKLKFLGQILFLDFCLPPLQFETLSPSKSAQNYPEN